jgi:hypothetical protein
LVCYQIFSSFVVISIYSKSSFEYYKTAVSSIVVDYGFLSSTLFIFFPLGELFGDGFSLMWMVTLFLTSGYLRLYPLKISRWSSFIGMCLCLVVYNLCSHYFSDIVILDYNSLVTYCLAIFTFLCFKDWQLSNTNLFAKIVFDENITEGEIVNTCSLCAKHLAELILQPKMNGNNLTTSNEFIERTLERFLDKYQKVRVIPQVHKFINVR